MKNILEWPDAPVEIGHGHDWGRISLKGTTADMDVWICRRCGDVLTSDPDQLTVSSDRPSCDQVIVAKVHGR